MSEGQHQPDRPAGGERTLDAYLREVAGPARAEEADAEELLKRKYEPIAVVGIGLRFPGGNDSPDEFDEFLRTGGSGIVPLPEDRWNVEEFTPQDPADPEEKGRIRTSGGGFLDRIDLFDAPFFNISPKEAQYIDPQQRMVLETAWKALEHANIDPTALRRGNGGVYIGASSIDYALELDALPYDQLDGLLASGITMFPLSGRLSYFLGWRGPSVSVDTACSSSLAALHMAAQGLRNGETDIALCGGVNALHHPRIPVMFSHANMLAPDGLCKTFDESADGYVRAEGCGILVLKRLSDASRDGDDVLAVIRGTAVGQDGDSAGLTVPNGVAQEAVMRRALEAALLEPADIQYVEAHGTGTPLGDPIELGAINDAFASGHSKESPLLVGSVKTNLGHMEPASGVVGLIKAVLQLRSGTVYPHLNLDNPSGRIPWDVYAVKVPKECTPYPAGTRRALVNSFGFAGTIGAAVLEEAPRLADARTTAGSTSADSATAGSTSDARATADSATADSASAAAPPRLFTVSAKSDAALTAQLARYRELLDARPDLDLDALCHTVQTGRAHFSHRLARPFTDRDDLLAHLDEEIAREKRPAAARIRRTAFLFTGQGSQYPGMGDALYRRHPVFRELVDECDALFAPLIGRSVRELVTSREVTVEDLGETAHTQPALFTLEYALAGLWTSWGVRPQALIGHSIGEVVAATVAGLFTLPDAVTLVAARSRLMQSVRADGTMAAVSAPAEDVEPLLADHPELALAAVNAPDQCVISGARASVEEVCAGLVEQGVRVSPLTVSHAFHSPQMAEVYDEFRAAIADVSFHEPRITLISNVTGRPARLAQIGNADYWVRHIGEPVRFMDGIRAVAKRGRHALIEIGPSTALTALAKRCVPAEDHLWLPSLQKRVPDGSELLRSLADYYAAGLTVGWDGYQGAHAPTRVTLPTYAFQRRRHWLPVALPSADNAGSAGPATHPLLGTPADLDADRAAAGIREFTAVLGARRLPALAGYRTPDGAELPPGAHVELLLALQDAVYGRTDAAVRALRLHRPLPLPEESDTAATVELRTRLVPLPDSGAEVQVEILSGHGEQEVLHADALLDLRPSQTGDLATRKLLRAEAEAVEVLETVEGVDVYTDLTAAGHEFGARLGTLERVTRYRGDLLVGELSVPPVGALDQLPLAALSGALHALSVVDHRAPALAPVRFGAIRLYKKPRADRLRVLARLRHDAGARRGSDPGADGQRTADLLLMEGDQPVALFADVELARAQEPDRQRNFLHRPRWLRRTAAPLDGTPLDGSPLDSAPAAERHAVAVLPAAAPVRGPLAERAAAAGARLSTVADTAALREALRDPSVTEVVWFWRPGEQRETGGPASAETLRAECEDNYRRLLETVAALADATGRSPRLWLVTERAQWLPDDLPGTGEQLAAGTLWGFGHTLLNEYPQYRPTLVDLPTGGDPGGLVAEWAVPEEGEHQIAFRDGGRYVRRLLPGDRSPDWPGGFELRPAAAGEHTEIVPVPAADRPPLAGEVQVRVYVAGLCAADVRRSAEGEDTVLGTGASGVVLAVGEGVGLPVGSQVLLRTGGTLRRTVTVPAGEVSPVPAGTPLTEAAAALAAELDTPEPDAARLEAGAADSAGPDLSVGELPGAGGDARSEVVCYGLEETDEALAALARGAAPGTVVVCLHPGAEPGRRPEAAAHGPARTPGPDGEEAVGVRPDRLYLITGGLGGLGLVTARKLVDLGARHLALVSRGGRATPEAAPVLAELERRAEIRLLRADVSRPEDVKRLTAELGEIAASGCPVGGIVHAAGAIGKSLVANLTWEEIDTQFGPKVYGGWLLHEAAESFPELDFFISYSSIAAVVGGATQAHYAGASAFLDGLTEWRAAKGLPATSANWGAWAAVGMSARLDDSLGKEIVRGGISFFSPSRALRTLDRMWREGAVRRVVGEVDWHRFTELSPVDNRLYARLVAPGSGRDTEGAETLDVAALVALPDRERGAAIAGVVTERVAATLRMAPDDPLDPTAEFVSLGLDSLMGMEVKSGLEKAFGLALPASLVFDHPSVQQLSDFLESRLVPQEAAA
ncbi:SDR family oxidoreductase [Streptomyces sp. XM4193]|uniref:type I polyketide synthase n=1 Tax=Streptomyces sp. XM4193 TaxID=2929782 RepID=UPI001FF751F3|nr:type I polyketide synthase [Streptomyces sp. XM4193]MCK1794591.1 SDR family oxidoreductase [Streptomyces sp. XM4193]